MTEFQLRFLQQYLKDQKIDMLPKKNSDEILGEYYIINV
jgi:hypothetical protein